MQPVPSLRAILPAHILVKTDAATEKPFHLVPQPLCITALSPAGACRNQPQFAHESRKTVAKLQAAASGLHRLRGNTEQQQPGQQPIRVPQQFAGLHVGARLDRKRHVAAFSRPQRHVARVAVRKGALHKLPRHERRFRAVWVKTDGRADTDELLLRRRERRNLSRQRFHESQFAYASQHISKMHVWKTKVHRKSIKHDETLRVLMLNIRKQKENSLSSYPR